jgi:hypothetical protein
VRLFALMLFASVAACQRPLPATAVPLADLQVSALQRDFDAAKDRPRIVALLSPS